jgi:hypothetical protein
MQEGKTALWRTGSRGDFHIVCARVARRRVPRAESLIKRHALLSSCGVGFDLVFLTEDGGDYHRPVRTAFQEFLRKLDRESFVGARAGINFLGTLEDEPCLLSAAALTVDLGAPPHAVLRDGSPLCCMPFLRAGSGSASLHGWTTEASCSASPLPASQGLEQYSQTGDTVYGPPTAARAHMWYQNAGSLCNILGQTTPLPSEGPGPGAC